MSGIDGIIFFAAAVVLLYAGGFMVRSLSWLGRLTGASEYAFSFVVAAFATSLPEFFIGVTSAIGGTPALSLGNIIGANVFDITLVLGVAVVLAGTLSVDHTIRPSDIQLTLGFLLFPVLLMLDGALSRSDGVLLLFFFGGYLIYLFDQHRQTPSINEIEITAYRMGNIFKHIGIFLGSTVLLLLSARVVVSTGIDIARMLELPLFFIGILAAFGTTLPELVFSVTSALRGRGGMSFGNALGSIIVNIAFVLGVVSAIRPIAAEEVEKSVAGLLLIAALVVAMQAMLWLRGSLPRSAGILLFMIALGFVLYSAS